MTDAPKNAITVRELIHHTKSILEKLEDDKEEIFIKRKIKSKEVFFSIKYLTKRECLTYCK